MLEDKIKYSIELLQRHEVTALKMNPEGYYLVFSGGKDSQVIYELCKMAGVKFKAHFSCTTVDPKEVLRFIHDKYPDVIWHRPEKSMFKLIEDKKCLPLGCRRYCCQLIKEIGGINNVTITGIRWYESRARLNRDEYRFTCIKGNDKIDLRPILHWTNQDVWGFIKKEIGFWCELYDKGFHRIGCILCPVVGYKSHKKELALAPRFKYAYIKAIKKCMVNGGYPQFDDAEDVFNWWIRKMPVKQYFANKLQYKIEL